jgi:hypothetical protein
LRRHGSIVDGTRSNVQAAFVQLQRPSQYERL